MTGANPDGAFYAFPKIDCLADGPWKDDKEFVLDFLNTEKLLTVHGSGFDKQNGKDHFRMVILPDMPTLDDAFGRLERFVKART